MKDVGTSCQNGSDVRKGDRCHIRHDAVTIDFHRLR